MLGLIGFGAIDWLRIGHRPGALGRSGSWVFVGFCGFLFSPSLLDESTHVLVALFIRIFRGDTVVFSIPIRSGTVDCVFVSFFDRVTPIVVVPNSGIA